MRTTVEKITDKSLKLFLAYAADAENWNGEPLVGGNIKATKESRGNLTQLKKTGYITTFDDDGCVWMSFTDNGKKLAADHGIEI